MAFLGVFPEVERPSFGTELARNLGSGLGSGLSQAGKFAQEMALQKQKDMPLESLLNIGKGQKGPNDEFNLLSPQQEAMLALKNPSAFNAYQTLKGSKQAEEQQKVQHEDLGNILNQMSDTLKQGKLGVSLKKYVTPEGRRDAQYFDSLGVQLESIAKEMISKGVLARDRFAYLLSNLPSSGKTDAANAGAIEAWADELKLPRPEGLENLYKKKSFDKGEVLMMDVEGNRYRIPSDKVKEAQKQGFKRQ